MNRFARFDENPAMTLRVIKEKKVSDGRTDNVKTVYPPQTKFAVGITMKAPSMHIQSLIREKLSQFSQLSFCQKLFFLNQTPSCICSMCLHCIGKVSNCSIKSCGRS